jgi:hypothetical protein
LRNTGRAVKLSARDEKILSLAKRETSPEHVAEFEPITKGFGFAVVALIFVLGIAAACMAYSFAVGIFSRGARADADR